MNPVIRPAVPSDLPALARLYREAIRQAGGEYYSPAQVEAWAGFAEDAAAFAGWLARSEVWVAGTADGPPAGFTGIEPPARISALFVDPGSMRRGVGTTLLGHALGLLRARDLETITAEASEFSRPLFERFGFTARAVEHTVFRGVAFTRHAMSLRLRPPRPGP